MKNCKNLKYLVKPLKPLILLIRVTKSFISNLYQYEQTTKKKNKLSPEFESISNFKQLYLNLIHSIF